MEAFGLLYASRLRRNEIRSSIEVVITGTTGNRVYPKRVPRVQIPPAPPEKIIPMLLHRDYFFNEICLRQVKYTWRCMK